MAFKPFGDTEPENITYNGNEVKVVNYNGTNVWGKPYTSSLTKTTGSGASEGNAYILRQSSQYEHASPSDLTTTIPMTGTKNVYYGDVIVVRFTCPEGSKISSATVRNNGQSVAVTKQNDRSYYANFFTVNGNISCSMTTVADGPSWHTIWTGEQTTLIKRINNDYTASINIGYAINSDWEYRITTYGQKSDTVGAEVVISQDDLPYKYTINIANIYKYTAIEATASAGSVYNDTVDVTIHSITAQGDFIITKIEAYY